MRHVILQIDISLDGFAARANGATDWISADDAMNKDALALLATADTILLGRTAYQMFSAVWPVGDFDPNTTVGQIANRINQAEKVIFSRTLAATTWGKWNNARLAPGDVVQEVQRLKAQPGANMILYAGASIVSAFIERGLVDRFLLRVHPVLLGTGLTIYPKNAIGEKLNLVATHTYSNGVVSLDYLR